MRSSDIDCDNEFSPSFEKSFSSKSSPAHGFLLLQNYKINFDLKLFFDFFYLRCFPEVVFAAERFLELFFVPLDVVVAFVSVLRSGTS